MASTGRGTASFTTATETRTYTFQVVSANTLFFMELEYLPNLEGTAQKQTAAFTNASLTGNYAFLLALPDISDGGETATVGGVTSDGAGNLTGGSVDENSDGTIIENAAVTGTYTVDSTGRGTATVSSASPSYTLGLAFYMVSPQEAYVMSTNPNTVQSGPLLAQQGGPFDNTSLSGPFAFRTLVSVYRVWTIGGVVLDGAGNLSGNDSIDAGGSLSSSPLTGTYTVDSSGRGTAALMDSSTTTTLVFYVVSGSKVLGILVDPTLVGAGTLDKQM